MAACQGIEMRQWPLYPDTLLDFDVWLAGPRAASAGYPVRIGFASQLPTHTAAAVLAQRVNRSQSEARTMLLAIERVMPTG